MVNITINLEDTLAQDFATEYRWDGVEDLTGFISILFLRYAKQGAINKRSNDAVQQALNSPDVQAVDNQVQTLTSSIQPTPPISPVQ